MDMKIKKEFVDVNVHPTKKEVRNMSYQYMILIV